MASTASILAPSPLSHSKRREKGATFFHQKALFFARGALRPSPRDLLWKSSSYGRRRRPFPTHIRPFSPVMEWQECRSEIEVDVPCSIAYDCYSDRETIPQWMPFISSVKILQDKPDLSRWSLKYEVFGRDVEFSWLARNMQILQDKPDLSRWSLKYEVFGRDVEFSWLARNMQPIPNQKIHWRSLDGLPNRKLSGWIDFLFNYISVLVLNDLSLMFIRGAVRFFPKGSSTCTIQLTVSYEVPEILIPVASALKPFLEGLLARGLERFAIVAKEYQRKIPRR
ncbi:hypothetical protein COCNU_01G000620 [Cocos nucifera]|uniref:Coenzyme Q-binding protein COQ10 START domain-containing protein n=1 Tax=Cocos nucifera TaxID=13894 RepID=A0A8K0MU27_COCNU|nr:hypothetical protein COCNU_01G000620 [Cocos nucifera]